MSDYINNAQPRRENGQWKEKAKVSLKTIAVYTLLLIALSGVLYARMEIGRAKLEKQAMTVQIEAQKAEIEQLRSLTK